MSGTSLDAVDAVAVTFSEKQLQIISALSIEIPPQLREKIASLCQPGENEIDRLGQLDFQLGELFASGVQRLLDKSQLQAKQVRAIGSHGQTIRHRPGGDTPFTLQIGAPALIAQRTGITTIADFRSRDIADGGEGAPLVPAFHAQQFDTPSEQRCILNIGGIANITRLKGKDFSRAITGFDCGPGNLLMDAWCSRHLKQPYDNNGIWAASGNIHQPLLHSLKQDPYFELTPPKSTGRELFNLPWLEQHLDRQPPILAADVQATLCELTAQSISEAIWKHAADTAALYVCGGGAHNSQLITRLTSLLAPINVYSSKKIGLDPDWVEACAFAWLAKRTLNGRPGNLPEVTGACQPAILGAIYPA